MKVKDLKVGDCFRFIDDHKYKDSYDIMKYFNPKFIDSPITMIEIPNDILNEKNMTRIYFKNGYMSYMYSDHSVELTNVTSKCNICKESKLRYKDKEYCPRCDQ